MVEDGVHSVLLIFKVCGVELRPSGLFMVPFYGFEENLIYVERFLFPFVLLFLFRVRNELKSEPLRTVPKKERKRGR